MTSRPGTSCHQRQDDRARAGEEHGEADECGNDSPFFQPRRDVVATEQSGRGNRGGSCRRVETIDRSAFVSVVCSCLNKRRNSTWQR